jgi:hypothetical protein
MAELFKSYGAVRVPYWPKVARIVIPSLILHTLLVAGVVYVPGIRDAFHLTKMMADLKMVDRDYKKTQITDNVQVINLAGDDVFRYPDGYFNTEPPVDMTVPVVIAQATPTPTPKPVPIPIPVQPRVVIPPMARNRTQKGPMGGPNGPKATPTPTPPPITGDPQQANQAADQVAEQFGIKRPHDDEINRKPLKDFVAMANDLFDQGKLDFSKPVEVVIEAELDDNAEFVNPHVVSKTGDGPLEDISIRMVGALSESGALRMFKLGDGSPELRKVRFTIRMDQTNFTAQIESEAPDQEKAKKMALGYGILLKGVEILRAGHDDEIAIAKGTQVHADGKKLIANFAMPREQAIQLMKKQVAANAKPES